MKQLTHEDGYQVLLLQAADDGRGPILFGDSVERARTEALPFLLGEEFPDVYFEFPLIGAPFLDVTLLYSKLDPGTRVDSPAAGEHGGLLDWFASVCDEHERLSCGFELDTKEAVLPEAAVHFQPRQSTELVRPFFEAIGEPERADLYLKTAEKMAPDWSLSFFGLFRGRPNSPLRVCGYISTSDHEKCAKDPRRITSLFDAVGFTAYDDAMLQQISALMATMPKGADFQLDVYPDGSVSPVFAVDVQFGIEQPEAVLETFTSGVGARIMGTLEEWGAADERWRLGAQAAFARGIPVLKDDGTPGNYAFTIMPQWAKARWRAGVLQPAKLYHLAHAGLLNRKPK